VQSIFHYRYHVLEYKCGTRVSAHALAHSSTCSPVLKGKKAVSFCLAHGNRPGACEWPAQPANQPAAHSDPVRTKSPLSQPRLKKINEIRKIGSLLLEIRPDQGNSEASLLHFSSHYLCHLFLRQHQAKHRQKCLQPSTIHQFLFPSYRGVALA